jgi:hypothetical protein
LTQVGVNAPHRMRTAHGIDDHRIGNYLRLQPTQGTNWSGRYFSTSLSVSK